MKYAITKSNGYKLNGFYGNGGWSFRDVFCFSKNNYHVFYSFKEAENYCLYMLKECLENQGRWGYNWTDKVFKFIKKLEIREAE